MSEVKKYTLDTYFQNKSDEDPETLLDIVNYVIQKNQTPFEYDMAHPHKDLLYDFFYARVKNRPVENSQYPTPPKVAQQLAKLTQSFEPAERKIMNACCGSGMIVKYLLKEGDGTSKDLILTLIW
ncbi:MAG: hypothetical protein LUH04_17780 [Clostridium sp.]|nr:hypothetical protein [Clostridium sp.]